MCPTVWSTKRGATVQNSECIWSASLWNTICPFVTLRMTTQSKWTQHREGGTQREGGRKKSLAAKGVKEHEQEARSFWPRRKERRVFVCLLFLFSSSLGVWSRLRLSHSALQFVSSKYKNLTHGLTNLCTSSKTLLCLSSLLFVSLSCLFFVSACSPLFLSFYYFFFVSLHYLCFPLSVPLLDSFLFPNPHVPLRLYSPPRFISGFRLF